MLFQLLGISHRCIQMNSMFCLRNFFGFIWKQSPFPHCVLMLSKWSDSDLSSQAGNFLWYKVFFILSKIWLSPLHKLLLRKDPHKIRIFSFRHSIQFMKRTFEFTIRRQDPFLLCENSSDFHIIILFSTLHIFFLLLPFLKNSIVIKKEKSHSEN